MERKNELEDCETLTAVNVNTVIAMWSSIFVTTFRGNLLPSSTSNPKMEAAGSFETLVPVFQVVTRRHSHEGRNLNKPRELLNPEQSICKILPEMSYEAQLILCYCMAVTITRHVKAK
jgi:hypothetical protein